MFAGTTFDYDISKWDVISVTNMDQMFSNAASFNHKLCGFSWIRSEASKERMFEGSSGSITSRECSNIFSPRSKAELQPAVDACLELSPEGDCANGPHGPIGEWDVSRVSDMSDLFLGASSFQGDISKWDVSSVKDMSSMFVSALSFDSDISAWDVSRVTHM